MEYNRLLNRIDDIDTDGDETIRGTGASVATGDDGSCAKSMGLAVSKTGDTTPRLRNPTDDLTSAGGWERDDSDAESASPPVSPLVTCGGGEMATTREGRGNNKHLNQELVSSEEEQPPAAFLLAMPSAEGILRSSVQGPTLSAGTGASSMSSTKTVLGDGQPNHLLDDGGDSPLWASGRQHQAPSDSVVPNEAASKAYSDSVSGSAAATSGRDHADLAPGSPLKELIKVTADDNNDIDSRGAGGLVPALPRAFAPFADRDADARDAAVFSPLSFQSPKSVDVIVSPTSSCPSSSSLSSSSSSLSSGVARAREKKGSCERVKSPSSLLPPKPRGATRDEVTVGDTIPMIAISSYRRLADSHRRSLSAAAVESSRRPFGASGANSSTSFSYSTGGPSPSAPLRRRPAEGSDVAPTGERPWCPRRQSSAHPQAAVVLISGRAPWAREPQGSSNTTRGTMIPASLRRTSFAARQSSPHQEPTKSSASVTSRSPLGPAEIAIPSLCRTLETRSWLAAGVPASSTGGLGRSHLRTRHSSSRSLSAAPSGSTCAVLQAKSSRSIPPGPIRNGAPPAALSRPSSQHIHTSSSSTTIALATARVMPRTMGVTDVGGGSGDQRKDYRTTCRSPADTRDSPRRVGTAQRQGEGHLPTDVENGRANEAAAQGFSSQWQTTDYRVINSSASSAESKGKEVGCGATRYYVTHLQPAG